MDAIDEVKARLSIEDVIGEYVQLKHSGRNWKGLSPFSNEKTASFIVSPEKQIWHDFSSGKGGDVFSFVMEVEGLDFKSTLELLARKAGIDLEQYRQQGKYSGPDKERLRQILKLSTKFYQVQFTKCRPALEYVLHKRQFSKETALTWQLGYAPGNGQALTEFLKGRGFNEKEVVQAGLSVKRYNGFGDMFRDRLMIPLQDQFGVVIGFTARLLADNDKAPKYINTPQTILYDKSRHVFGLHLAKEAIRQSHYAVVTEGNLDVISSHQAGISQVVAIAGTAFTERHLKSLSHLTSDIRLSFDADRAGLAATERAIPMASKLGISLNIISINNAKDPDELIRHDSSLWQEAINRPTYALDWLIGRYKQELDVSSAPGKRQFSDILLPLVARLGDSVEQDHYMQRIADILDVSADAIRSKMKNSETQQKVRQRPHVEPQPLNREQIEYLKLQDHLLALMLNNPNLRNKLIPITPAILSKGEAKQLLSILRSTPALEKTDLRKLKPVGDYVKILLLEYEELYQDVEPAELENEATRVQARLIEAYVKQQKQKLAAKFATASDGQTSLLLNRVKQLDKLLNYVTGGV